MDMSIAESDERSFEGDFETQRQGELEEMGDMAAFLIAITSFLIGIFIAKDGEKKEINVREKLV